MTSLILPSLISLIFAGAPTSAASHPATTATTTLPIIPFSTLAIPTNLSPLRPVPILPEIIPPAPIPEPTEQKTITTPPPQPTDKLIALTFDDGPHPSLTPRLLDILLAHQIPATFYVIGQMAERNPQIVARAHRNGHEIGNHSWDHAELTRLTPDQIRHNLAITDDFIQSIIGHRPATFRPPYGSHNHAVRHATYSPIILWSIDPKDWQIRDPTHIHNFIRENATDGAIILLHDIHETTIEAVPKIIESLLQDGFTFVTISDLLRLRNSPTEPHTIHLSAPPH